MTLGTRKERKREQQRQEILAAARALFLKEGQTHFSMRKLAGVMGCVPGTLYLYFRNKEDLVALLVEESFEHLMQGLEAQPLDGQPLRVLKEMMHAYIDFGLTHPDHYYFAFMLHRTEGLDRVRPRPHRSYVFLRRTVGACMDQGIFRPVDLEVATQGVWTGIHGVVSLMITMPNFPWGGKKAVTDHVVCSLIAGLLQPISAAPIEGGTDHV